MAHGRPDINQETPDTMAIEDNFHLHKMHSMPKLIEQIVGVKNAKKRSLASFEAFLFCGFVCVCFMIVQIFLAVNYGHELA